MNIANNIKFWGEFLELYESLPALWKMKSEEYGNRKSKAEAYNKMVEKLKEVEPNACREMVVRKINTFRTNYRRDLRKVKASLISETETGDIFQSSLWYFDILSFLDEQEDPFEGISSSNEYKSLNLKQKNTTSPILSKKKKILKKVLKHEDVDNLVKVTCEDLNESNDKVIKMANNHLKEDNDEAIILAKGWATQYAQLTKKQKILSRKIISDVLFHSCLDHLTENTVQEINKVLDKSDWNTDSNMESRMKFDTANL